VVGGALAKIETPTERTIGKQQEGFLFLSQLIFLSQTRSIPFGLLTIFE
jgi:hypothetical protein